MFNFAVVANACQQVDRQSLQVKPETTVAEAQFAEGSRHMRLQVPEGEVSIDYRAVGTLLPVRVPMADAHVGVAVGGEAGAALRLIGHVRGENIKAELEASIQLETSGYEGAKWV